VFELEETALDFFRPGLRMANQGAGRVRLVQLRGLAHTIRRWPCSLHLAGGGGKLREGFQRQAPARSMASWAANAPRSFGAT
jgi:hypothetical protein